MAKIRNNHQSSSRFGKGSVRIIIALLFMVSFIVVIPFYFEDIFKTKSSHPEEVSNQQRFYLPSGSNGEKVHHSYYSLSYNEEHEQAEWVSYILSKKDLLIKNVPRSDWFEADPMVSSKSAHHKDYSSSGYTRGHLAPAADMAFSKLAMEECFYMSNMSPQIRALNNGIWRELEELTRDWAFDRGALYVVTGPIIGKRPKKIGRAGVSVPDSFYKVLLDLETKSGEAIAFIIPHEKSDKHLRDYAVSIDSVEAITGFDLFGDMLNDNQEERIEASIEVNKWDFDEKKFRQRVDKWNRQ